jgi:hypothetical protein
MVHDCVPTHKASFFASAENSSIGSIAKCGRMADIPILSKQWRGQL